MDEPILTMEEREAINGGRWFASLSPSLRHDILRCAFVKRYPDGALISARGDAPEQWIACAKGAVRVSSTTLAGKQVTLTYVEPGVWFGDVAMFDGDRRTHDTYAHGATTILCVTRADFQKILAQHVELYEALMRLQARRIRLLFGQVEDLNSLPLRARLAKQLLHLARSYGVPNTPVDDEPHLAAAGAGRTGAAAGRLAPARQPGAEDHGARGGHPHRAGRPHRARPRGAAAHRRGRALAISRRSA
jgi:CRP-like cAMP-binding protein